MDADEYGPSRSYQPYEETAEPDLCDECGTDFDRSGVCRRCAVDRDGRRPDAFFARQQAERDARLAAERFTGVSDDLVTGRWLLWVRGRVVGQVDAAGLAMRLRPVLADAAREAPVAAWGRTQRRTR